MIDIEISEIQGSRPWQVDVPVRIQVWNRPDCQRQQFEVLRKAAPRVLFLTSDGGRTDEEMHCIEKSREILEGIDWNCVVHKLYSDENQGLYAFGESTISYVWDRVDRCIFLEDDYVPAVSFFQYCAELLERYKDDERIEMITGNNPFGFYEPAKNQDYFFTEQGWSIWGVATWRRTWQNRSFPLPYANDEYIKQCLIDNVPEHRKKAVEGYCSGYLVGNHVPGSEYAHWANSALYHRLSIVPTKNLICNIGIDGEHAHLTKNSKQEAMKYFNVPVHEIEFPMRHPQYIIDDVSYSKEYIRYLNLDLGVRPVARFRYRAKQAAIMAREGQLLKNLRRRKERKHKREK